MTSIDRYRNDDPRTAEEIADAIESELKNINSIASTVEGTENYAVIQSMAQTLADKQEQSLVDIYDAGFITDASDEELTKKAREIGVFRKAAQHATGVAEFTSDSAVSQDRTYPSGSRIGTGGGESITFETTETALLEAPKDEVDSTLYSTTSTTFVTKASFTVDVSYRDSLDVSADIRITDGTYTAELDVVDTTNSVTIASFSTQNTTLTSKGPTTYDTSSITGDIKIEFQLRTTDSSATAELDESTVSLSGEYGDKANIRAVNSGPDGNVGAGTITVFIESFSGVDDVTNPNPTGDTSYTLTDGNTPLIHGRERETDPELRDRALESTAIGGSGTAQAVELALENTKGIISADVFTNRSDNTVDGVDPWHSEVRVYGGNIDVIADKLYDVMPVGSILTLQGGVNGTLESTTIHPTDLFGDLTIEITRPAEVSLYAEIEVVHTADYAGASDVKDAVVDYIGGTDTSGQSITGLAQGENVLINEVENVAEDVPGVDYANINYMNSAGDTSDGTTTDSDGVPIYSITDTEVPVMAASDLDMVETAR